MAGKRVIGIAGLAIAILALLLLWMTNAPPSRAGNVATAFIGYTNDLTGQRIASFIVSNASSRTIAISSYFLMCSTDRSWPINDVRIVLGCGETVPLQLPTRAGRCTFIACYSDYDWRGTVRYFAAHAHLLRLVPNNWGQSTNLQSTTINVPDDVNTKATAVPK